MFQTEPILFLQQFAGGGLTWAMRAITALGYPPFFFVALTVVMFGVDLRRGFVLAQFVMWTDVLTEFAKAFFALPRPSDVDSGVRLLETGRTNTTPWTGKGAPGFLALPDREAVAWLRSQAGPSFGLPSGHVSVTTAFWGGLSAVFRSRALLAIAAVAVPLAALSRMYLGRHFLGDVLAGGALGALVVLLGSRLLVGGGTPLPLLRLPRVAGREGAAVLAFLLVLPVLVLVLGSQGDAGRAGRLLGLNLAYLLVAAKGLTDGGGTPVRRVARVAVALLLGVAAALAGEVLAPLATAEGPTRMGAFAKGFVPTFVLLWGGVLVCRLLGLYGPPPPPAASWGCTAPRRLLTRRRRSRRKGGAGRGRGPAPRSPGRRARPRAWRPPCAGVSRARLGASEWRVPSSCLPTQVHQGKGGGAWTPRETRRGTRFSTRGPSRHSGRACAGSSSGRATDATTRRARCGTG